MKETINYFNGDDMAANVWQAKYALEGETTPDDMHWRMASEFARIEDKYYNLEHLIKNPELSEFGKRVFSSEKPTVEDIFGFFKDFKFIIPQGSVMSMLGNPKIGSLSNCFIVGQPEDSYGGIMQKDQELVQLMKRRGGVGIDISTLRPRGTGTNNAAKSSTGAASFMERYSNSTREVAQDGRRGALMLTIDCRHPDVLEFINAKKDRTKVTGANISVMLRDDFMEAVKNDDYYMLRFPCDTPIMDYDWEFEGGIPDNGELKHIKLGTTECWVKQVKAKEIYDAIVENAWENAEPGQMFIDRQWNYSPDSVYPQYKGITTNPCGEIFMQPYDACRLIALNLFSFVNNPFTDKAAINWKYLYRYAYWQQRLADDLVDLELEHINRIIDKIKQDEEPEDIKATELNLWKKIRGVAASGRRTGSGFTALGDMLAALGLKYDSPEAKQIINDVMRCKMQAELDCTIDLAILRGTFDGWNKDKEYYFADSVEGREGTNSFYSMLLQEFPEQVSKMVKYGRRNISFSTVAPTGTVSLMTQTTSGLEPLFMPYYIRRKKINPNDKESRVDFVDQNGDSWQEYPILHPKFRDWVEKIYIISLWKPHDVNNKFDITDPADLTEAFEESPWYGSTANDINWIDRVEIQAIIQKYITHSISSTINLPETVSKEDVAKIYLAAYDAGLKGVTVYRDGSRTGVLVSKKDEGFQRHHAPKRPKELPCEIHHLMAKGERWTVFVGVYENNPYEVFALRGTIAKEHDSGTLVKGGSGTYYLNTGGKNVVLASEPNLEDSNSSKDYNITSGMTDEEAGLTRMISTALRHGADIQFVVEQLQKSGGDIVSFTKAIARTLSRYIADEKLLARATCQDCASTNLRMEEGCVKCNDCGSSKCG